MNSILAPFLQEFHTGPFDTMDTGILQEGYLGCCSLAPVRYFFFPHSEPAADAAFRSAQELSLGFHLCKENVTYGIVKCHHPNG